jgi:hypothetical protein
MDWRRGVFFSLSSNSYTRSREEMAGIQKLVEYTTVDP